MYVDIVISNVFNFNNFFFLFLIELNAYCCVTNKSVAKVESATMHHR